MHFKRNIPLLCCIALLQGMVFYAPIASLYRQAAGLNLAQIALIEGISYILTLAMEIPWGLLADRIGYRKTMAAGCAFYFFSKLIFWRADGFSGFLLERFVLSIALAGISGVDEGLLYLSCEPDQYQRIFGSYEACGAAGMLAASGIYSLFIGSNYRFAALATMITYGAAALLSLFLVEVRNPQSRPKEHASSFILLFKQTLRNRSLLVFLAGFALFQEAVQTVTVWLNQNQFLRCGMGASAIGLAHILSSIAMLFGAQSKRFTDVIGPRRFTTAALLLSASGCIALVFTRSAHLSVLCVAMVAAMRALLSPLAGSMLNRSIASADRATVLSTYALLQNLCAAGAQTVFGRAADFSLNAAFMLCALACIFALPTFLIFSRRTQSAKLT